MRRGAGIFTCNWADEGWLLLKLRSINNFALSHLFRVELPNFTDCFNKNLMCELNEIARAFR